MFCRWHSTPCPKTSASLRAKDMGTASSYSSKSPAGSKRRLGMLMPVFAEWEFAVPEGSWPTQGWMTLHSICGQCKVAPCQHLRRGQWLGTFLSGEFRSRHDAGGNTGAGEEGIQLASCPFPAFQIPPSGVLNRRACLFRRGQFQCWFISKLSSYTMEPQGPGGQALNLGSAKSNFCVLLSGFFFSFTHNQNEARRGIGVLISFFWVCKIKLFSLQPYIPYRRCDTL